jgi:hypothetical protein
MPPSDKTSYKIPTRAAKKTAQTKSRKRDVDLAMERITDALFPVWPGERNPWVIARHFALSPRGLDLMEDEWLRMDLEDFVARTRDWWVKRHVWVHHALYRAPGPPVSKSTKRIGLLHRQWCKKHGADPKEPVKKECLMDIIQVLYPNREQSPEKRRHAIEEGVRDAIKTARRSPRNSLNF